LLEYLSGLKNEPPAPLEAQSSRRKFIFARAGDDARAKELSRFAAIANSLAPLLLVIYV
jgi:hypothetical protein